MKIALAMTAALLVSGGAFAQQAPTNWQCHTLASSGNYVAPDEQIVNGMACKQVPATTDVKSQQQSTTSAPAGQPSTSPTADNVPVAPVELTPASTRIVPGGTVYIAPMNGFENYLAAALLKKKVQLIAVANPDKAQYIISGTSDQKKAGWAKMAFTGNIHSDDAASVTMADRRTGAIVFAYAVDKKNTLHGQQTTAEACAKHLQEKIESKN